MTTSSFFLGDTPEDLDRLDDLAEQAKEQRWAEYVAGHNPISGADFMSEGWCGGCESCSPEPRVCAFCSYDTEGHPNERPTIWPCCHADPVTPSTTKETP